MSGGVGPRLPFRLGQGRGARLAKWEKFLLRRLERAVVGHTKVSTTSAGTKENNDTMNAVLHLLAKTFGRPTGGRGGYDPTSEPAADERPRVDDYVRAIEEARTRRGRLLSRH